ncbi:MAG TPA: L-2-hydroxyglutarate oxidase [Steroidobacteraceae bacterium]
MSTSVRIDFCIVGGGIIGLATALALLTRKPHASLLLLEKEQELATHQTGHNSGVIHAGVYYAPGSWKARLCREGNELIRQFCLEQDVRFEVCGKLIVATSALEVTRLEALRERCVLNHIETVAVSADDLGALEPRIAGRAALLVPGSGIVSYRQVSLALARRIRMLGGTIALGSQVEAIAETPGEVQISTMQGHTFSARHLIVCAGLQSDRIARLAGLRPGVRIVPFRGQYFRLPGSKNDIVRHLIYPVPDPALPFLGIHLTRTIDGGVTVGPNALVGFAREGYGPAAFNLRDTSEMLFYRGFWRLLRMRWRSAVTELRTALNPSLYLAECRKYCPELSLDDLEPHPTGIRAQAVGSDGTLVHDFLFAETARMLHVLNAPSPAATAALPIGRMIAQRALHEADGTS